MVKDRPKSLEETLTLMRQELSASRELNGRLESLVDELYADLEGAGGGE